MNLTSTELLHLLGSTPTQGDGGARVSELEAERAGLRDEVAALRTALLGESERLHGRISEQVDTIIQADRDAATLRERAQTLQSALCTANESLRRLETECRMHAETATRLQADWRGDRERTEHEAHALQTELDKAKREINRLRCDLDTANRAARYWEAAGAGGVDQETARLAELGRRVEAMAPGYCLTRNYTKSEWIAVSTFGAQHRGPTPAEALRAAGIGDTAATVTPTSPTDTDRIDFMEGLYPKNGGVRAFTFSHTGITLLLDSHPHNGTVRESIDKAMERQAAATTEAAPE